MQTYASQYSTLHSNDQSQETTSSDNMECLKKSIRKICDELEKFEQNRQ